MGAVGRELRARFGKGLVRAEMETALIAARFEVPYPEEIDHPLADSALAGILADAALRLGYGCSEPAGVASDIACHRLPMIPLLS